MLNSAGQSVSQALDPDRLKAQLDPMTLKGDIVETHEKLKNEVGEQ